MDSALLLGVTTRSALNRRMDVLAHNVANLNTTAFKAEKVVFEQLLVDLPNAEGTVGGQVSYVVDKGVRRSFESGPLINTGNPLDVYLSDGGFLTVETAQGETMYTRNGRMTINNAGELSTLNGDAVLDDGGARIVFDQQDQTFSISEDGTINSNNGDVAKLGIATFADPQVLERAGTSLYTASAEPQEPENATDVTITSGAIEGSNVNAIQSMVDLLQIAQSSKRVSDVGSDYAELREDAIRRLGRVQSF